MAQHPPSLDVVHQDNTTQQVSVGIEVQGEIATVPRRSEDHPILVTATVQEEQSQTIPSSVVPVAIQASVSGFCFDFVRISRRVSRSAIAVAGAGAITATNTVKA